MSVVVAALLLAQACEGGKFGRDLLRQGEYGFRAAALRVVVPKYPAALAQRRIEGVAVAAVVLWPNGSVRRVDVLQAPHPDIAREVVTALEQWRFPVVVLPGSKFAATVHGKLTYYFVVDGGKGTVLTPEEQAARRNPEVVRFAEPDSNRLDIRASALKERR